MVKDDFYVVVNTDSRKKYGIRFGIDKSIKNTHSEVARDGKLTWDLNIPKDTTNWMIRVVGSTPPPSTTTPAPTLAATLAPTTAPPTTPSAPVETPAKGICGPTLVALIAVLSLFGYGWLRNKRR